MDLSEYLFDKAMWLYVSDVCDWKACPFFYSSSVKLEINYISGFFLLKYNLYLLCQLA